MATKKTESTLWSVRVSEEFRRWGEQLLKSRGLDKALCTAAAIHHLLRMDADKRESVIADYLRFAGDPLPDSSADAPDEHVPPDRAQGREVGRRALKKYGHKKTVEQ